MTDKNSDIERRLRDALPPGQAEAEAGRVPDFDAVWAAAESNVSRRRRRMTAIGGVAAGVAIIAVVIFGQLQPAERDWQFVDPDEIASSTSWAAPSDVLLPKHQFDIYGEIPVLIESTGTSEGALL
ncbi:MAG: hypothetical protein EX272_13610 [Chromatiales bacterium]|nr:MAG: hypothetical protein EX272_13610 [Chromatiales bacterium]